MKFKDKYVDARDSNPDFEMPEFSLDEVPHSRRDGLPYDSIVQCGLGLNVGVGFNPGASNRKPG